MKVLDLFSGIGGFSVGLERAGMETIAFCEKDMWCKEFLKKNWPSVPIHDDVKTLDGKQYEGSIDVVCGGYPCQPFSVAGRQRAGKDERHLWPEMLRIIQTVRPRWIVSENVLGHIELGFDEMASSLENEGFTIWPFDLPASAIGSPQTRERICIVGYANDTGGHAAKVARSSDKAIQNNTQRQKPSRKPKGTNQPMDSRVMGDRHHPILSNAHWACEPELARMANGLPTELDKARIAALGNTIIPDFAEAIGHTIQAFEAQQ